MLSLPVTFLWSEYGYPRRKLDQEKQQMLSYLDNLLGFDMMKLNDILPRYWLEPWVNQYVVRLYFARNSFLTGVIFGQEGKGGYDGRRIKLGFNSY